MNNSVVQKLKLAGCMSVATGFLFLVLSNLGCPYVLTLSAWALLIAGIVLFCCKCKGVGAVIAMAGGVLLCYCASADEKVDVSVVLWIPTLILCSGTICYFRKTKLKWVAIITSVKLFLLQTLYLVLKAAFPHGGFMHVVVLAFIVFAQLVLAACFISQVYQPLEEMILKYAKILSGKMLSAFKSAFNSRDGFCKFYAYSAFVIGVICAVVLFFWASPVKGAKEWNPVLIKKAITQVVGCAIWGCFILSQISCAMKLQGRRIAERTAPVYLLVANFLCWLLVLCAVIGTVHMLWGDIKQGTEMTIDMSYLTMNLVISLDSVGLVCIPTHCNPKIALTLSSIVAIWHLIGSSFVALLIRDNIAKVRSLELNTTEE